MAKEAPVPPPSGRGQGEGVLAILPLVFPIAQAILFVLALSHPSLFPLALLAMVFTLHVTAHECVHHPAGSLAESAMSLFLGVPFEGYRLHHQNHHRFENGLEDWSTTRAARGPILYALGWPSQLLRGWRSFRGDPTLPKTLRLQQILLLLWAIALGVLAWKALLLWLAMVYLGWALIALHNYGQHPPRGETTSLASPVYNALTCNNGLHAEHHRAPGVPWNRLVASHPSIRFPPMLAALWEVR
jgi:fatty acid desaturase